MQENHKKTICFIHYGIGWRDGVNTVIKTLARQIREQNSRLNLCFIGGEIKEKFLEKAEYQEIPELLPASNHLSKGDIEERGLVIAKKIGQATEEADVVIVENPFIGEYHLSAMLGFSIYAAQYKSPETKVFFRIHDLYTDNPQYRNNFWDLFSSSEIKSIVKGDGVKNFFIISRDLKEKLVKEGIPKEKVSYLPNGIDGEKFKQPLTTEDLDLIHQNLGIPNSGIKDTKILLYPVRVVPRKNIEEAILLTQYIRQITGENYILVIPGKVDKHDSLSHEYCKILEKIIKLANFSIILTKKPLPLKRKYSQSGKVKEYSIGDLYQASYAIIMTSLREGFGYPFLECWFAKRNIIGRRIQNVIKDFEESGLSFGWLYDDFLLGSNSLGVGDEKNFKRAKRIYDIFKDEKLKAQILELNKDNVLKQVEVLQNRERRKDIIKSNFKMAGNIYNASKIAKRFLELVDINERSQSE